MTSITQTIDNYIGGISQQPDEKKLPGQLVKAKNVLPDVVEGLKKRPGSNLIASLSDGNLNSDPDGKGKWFHYYRDENEQYVGQISRDGVVKMWDCLSGSEKTVTNNLNTTSQSATYSRNTSGVITVTLANHGFTTVGEIVNLDFTSGTAVDDVYSITGVTSTSVFTVKDSTTAATSGNVTVKTNYLYHLKDSDLQTLTLNDYTYITNRNKITRMSDLGSGSFNGEGNYNNVRPPEAFVELKKVSYARQYALNLYDDDDTTEEEVTTATRISIKREVDSSNSCSDASPNVFPSSGTLPGSSGYATYCIDTNDEHEDSACPNVDTKIFSFTFGADRDPDDANGVAGNFTFFRNGTEQVLYETQTLAITGENAVGSEKVYKLAGNDITDITLPATDSSATIAELEASIKAHDDYGKDDSNAADKWSISSQNITAGQPEIQTIALASGWNYGASNETVLTINNVSISIRAGSCNLACIVNKLKEHDDYGNLAATIALDGTDVIVTYKNSGTYPLATMKDEWGAIVTATRTQESIENEGTLRIVFKTEDLDAGACTLENVTDSSTQTFTQINPSSSLPASEIPKDLYFRITTTGQAVAESGTDSSNYRCRYTTTHDLLYGGQNWLEGDYFYVWMRNAKYRITIDKISTSTVQANRGLIRPTPTSFDTKTVVNAESILGDLKTEIDNDPLSNFNDNENGDLNSTHDYTSAVTQVGNGLHITTQSILNADGEEENDFNINTPSPDLLNVFTTEIQDIADLPTQCVNGYTVKIRNSEATEDDYYVRFIADNSRSGTGVWEECPEPGRKIQFNKDTMPIQLVRNADGTFTLDEIDWQICLVGNTTSVPEPSFIDKTINKMLFWRNRMVLLSDENVIMSQPGEYFNFWPKSSITYTATDVIDISVSSEFPAIIYDGVQTNSGLLLFSKNQQYLVTTDSDVLSPQTAKINTISTYNFNFNTNPISLGTTTAFLDNAGKFSRLWEMANVLREGEPVVVDQTKVVSKLFDKDLTLIANSRENSIIFFTKKDSSTIYGYKYFNSSEKRLQQSWFTWELAGAIQHIAVLDDALFIVLRNNSKDALQKIPIKIDDDTHTSVDDKGTEDTSDDVTYRIHLDNSKVVASSEASYSAGTNKTTFTLPDGFNNSSGQLVVYVVPSGNDDTFSGMTANATLNGTTVELPGNWKTYVEDTYKFNASVPSSNIITSVGHKLSAHDRLQYFSGGGTPLYVGALGDLEDGVYVWVHSTTDDTFQLKSSADETQGVSVLSDGNSDQYFIRKNEYTPANNFVLGYNYDMEIQFPTIYYTQQTGDAIKVDTNGSLVIQRVKVNFGGKGLYETTIDRVGKPSYTEKWEAPLADSYDANQVAIDDFITQTIPIYEKNKNLTIKLKSTHPTPATLYSMSWEGDYTTNYYQRV